MTYAQNVTPAQRERLISRLTSELDASTERVQKLQDEVRRLTDDLAGSHAGNQQLHRSLARHIRENTLLRLESAERQYGRAA